MINFCTALIVGISINLFETPPLFPEPLAYVRVPETSFQLATESELFESKVKYFKAEIGRTFSIFTLDLNQNHQFQIAGQAGTWLTLGYDDGAFPLLTEDFLIGMPVYYRYKNLYLALKFNHISAHLGDGVEKILRSQLSDGERQQLKEAESFLDPYDVSIRLRKPIVYSRDFWSTQSAYKFKGRAIDTILYTNVGYINKSRPKYLDRWFYGGGIEFRLPTNTLDIIYSQDMMYYQDVGTTDYSGELGVEVNSDAKDLIKVRLVLTSYIGSDRRGQLLGEKIREVGIGLVIR